MNLVRNLWLMLFGMKRELDAMKEKLDRIECEQKKTNEIQMVFMTNLSLLFEQQNKILAILQKIQAELLPPPAVALVLSIGGKEWTMAYQLADNGSVVATLAADDALGNPGAALSGVPAWSLSDVSFGSIAAAADGMSAVVTPSGKLGTFQVQVSALASDGVTALSASGDVQVVPGAAVSLGLSFAAPVAAPVAPSA